MANALISDLSPNAALADTDLFEIEQTGPSSRKLTLSTLLAYVLGNITYPVVLDTVTALSINAGVVTIDLDGGRNRNFTLALTTNVTSVVFTNPPAAGFVAWFELQITQDGTGGRTFAIPASLKALGGSDIVIASAANAVTILSAKTWDQGTSWAYAMQERAA